MFYIVWKILNEKTKQQKSHDKQQFQRNKTVDEFVDVFIYLLESIISDKYSALTRIWLLTLHPNKSRKI